MGWVIDHDEHKLTGMEEGQNKQEKKKGGQHGLLSTREAHT
jgi:hypothetical protein